MDLLFVEWKEKFVSEEKGNRVVHYLVMDSAGGSLLAIVGTERSHRHIVYVVADEFLRVCGTEKSTPSGFKWNSRREVVDWLTSLVAKQQPSLSGYLSKIKTANMESSEDGKDPLVWEEEKAKFLLECMLEQSHIPGMKAKGILKPSAMKMVENKMCEKFGPQFNRDKIRNKLKKLKANLVICKTLLSKGEFSFDSVRKCLVVDADTWTKHINCNPKHKGFRSSKHWKHYEVLSEIFGDSAATRQISGSYEHLGGFQDEAGSSQMPPSQVPPVDVELDDDTPKDSALPSRSGSPSRGPIMTNSKRRKSTCDEITTEGLERFIKAMDNFTNSTVNMRKECSKLLRMYCDSRVINEDEVNDALEIFESENLAKCFITYPEENRIIWLRRKLCAARQ